MDLIPWVIGYIVIGVWFRVYFELKTKDDLINKPMSEFELTLVFIVLWPWFLYDEYKK